METIQAMRVQEERGYRCRDYLYQDDDYDQSIDFGPQNAYVDDTDALPVDEDCRQKMANWCYSVVDYCGFSRDTVAVAMSYLDRYLTAQTSNTIIQDRKQFQLVAMTCLYTAVKVHESEAMEPQLVASMSNGMYTPEQIVQTESSILFALQFRMNPPTSLSFVRQFMALLDGVMDDRERRASIELAKFQCELAVNDYELCAQVPASSVAFAALANALHCTNSCSHQIQHNYLNTLAKIADVDIINSAQVINVQERLCRAVEQSSKDASHLVPKTNKQRSTTTPPPTATALSSSSSSLAYQSASHFMKSFVRRFV